MLEDDDSNMEKVISLKKRMKDENLNGWNIPDDYLNRFLTSVNFNVDDALTKLNQIYDLMKNHPEWYDIPEPVQLRPIIESNIRVVIPGADKCGRPIYIAKLGNVDVTKQTLYDQLNCDDIWLEYLLLNDPNVAFKGLCVIVDVENYSWRLLKWITPENIKLSIQKLHCLPFREFRFHVVNKSFFINTAIRIVWPFFPQHLKDMIKFHFDDYNSFHEYIDKEILPVEYGGYTLVNYSDYHNKLLNMNDEIVASFKKYRKIC